MELMIGYHLLLNVQTSFSTTDQVVKEMYLENVAVEELVVVILLLEEIEVEEIDEWMTEGEQLMMNILYSILLKTVVIEVNNRH